LLLPLQGAARTRSPTPPTCATAAIVTALSLTQRLREGQRRLCRHWNHRRRQQHLPHCCPRRHNQHSPHCSRRHPQQRPPSPSRPWRQCSSARRPRLQPCSRASRCLQLRPRQASPRVPSRLRSAGSRPAAQQQLQIEHSEIVIPESFYCLHRGCLAQPVPIAFMHLS
jgi:hypothetical protein